MDADPRNLPTQPDERRLIWRSPALVACAMLVVIGAFFLLREHWGHVTGRWPYLLLFACPLMHFFMHGDHDHGHHHDRDAGDGRR